MTLALAGCGAAREAGQRAARFPVQVTIATFPSSQRLAERSDLVIVVRNAGERAIPDVAVTLTNPRWGTSVQAFATYLEMPGVASHSRPAWVVDKPPGRCAFSCRAGGPGAAASSYSNTWALGRLAPGATATFDWGVTAVRPGTFRVRYEVAAGLSGHERAVRPDGSSAVGAFAVTIHAAPARSYVTDSGEIVTGR